MFTLIYKLDLNFKAIGYGALAFLGCYFANLLLLPLLLSGANALASEGANYVFWFLKQIIGIAVLFIPGFLAGRIAAQRGFTHGIITGVIGTFLTALAATLVSLLRSRGIPISGTILFWLVTNAAISGLGGMAGEDPRWVKSK